MQVAVTFIHYINKSFVHHLRHSGGTELFETVFHLFTGEGVLVLLHHGIGSQFHCIMEQGHQPLNNQRVYLLVPWFSLLNLKLQVVKCFSAVSPVNNLLRLTLSLSVTFIIHALSWCYFSGSKHCFFNGDLLNALPGPTVENILSSGIPDSLTILWAL